MGRREEISKSIINLLARNRGVYFKQRDIWRRLNLEPSDYDKFKKILRALAEDGRIERGSRNRYWIPDITKTCQREVGTISFTSRGFSFVMTEDGEEIFIGAYDSGTALNHDVVLVEKYPRQSGKRAEGKVVEVIERSKLPVYATLKKEHSRWVAVPEQPSPPVRIVLRESRVNCREGQIIEVTNIKWDNPKETPVGEIKQVLGAPDNPLDDLLILKKRFKLSESFPRRVIEEVKRIEYPDVQKELEYRIDLREKEIFTIDPPEAMDYDDAISLEIDSNGDWILGVHISDVSHFVPLNSFTDLEARRRGTSIYFAEGVIPMLPVRLSNELCSLQPGVDRLTLSLIMRLDGDGNVIEFNIKPSVINSKNRFTYEEVQRILNTGGSLPTEQSEVVPHFATLNRMRILSKVLYEKRSRNGSIDFDIPEPIFKIDSNGIPYELKPSERLESHRIVEEFMIAANRSIANWIAVERREENLPFIYRVHEPPSDEAINSLYDILNRLGTGFVKPEKFTSMHLKSILEETEEMPFKNFVEQVSLRSMSKAVYSSCRRRAEHFGLAFKHYTHFTSPVRRYPDLMVHRLVKLYLNQISNDHITYFRRLLPKIASSCSKSEIKAMEIEREYLRIKQIRFLANRIGEWFTGIITGVIAQGFFVEISDFLVEGFVHVKSLYDDFYVYSEGEHSLIGRRYKRKFRLGDIVNVRVMSVSIPEKRVDLEWGE